MIYFTRLRELKFEDRQAGDIVIREAKPQDAREVAELYRLSFPEHILVKWGVLSDPEKVREQFELDNKQWAVAEDKGSGQIVGCAALEVSEWNAAGEIERVVVDRYKRGNGIAKVICGALKEHAEQIGLEYLFAHSRGPMAAMQRTFESLGFRVAGIMPVFYVNHDGRTIRENFVYQEAFINGGEAKVESDDAFIPAAKRLKKLIDLQ